MSRAFLVIGTLWAVLAACPSGAGQPAGSPAIAIEHVTVLPMTPGDQALRDATVIVRSGRITAIGPSGTQSVPAHARVVDGAGKWLMPGLADMHVHPENGRLVQLVMARSVPGGKVPRPVFDNQDIFLPYVANGVTQIMNMSAMSEAVGQRDEIEKGLIIGPHMALAAMVDGDPPIWPPGMTRVAATPEDGRQVVRDIKADGFDFVKTYSHLNLDTFTAIVQEANQLGLKVVGHIPGRGLGITDKFLQPGFDMVAHAEEYAYQAKTISASDIPRYVELAKKNDTWLTSTLTTDVRILQEMQDPASLGLEVRPEMRFVQPVLYAMWVHANPYLHTATPQHIERLREVVAFNQRLVRAFAKAGIPVLPGTDSLVPGVVAGVSLHDELELLARAGMTNEQILQAATRQSAKWLGTLGDRGTVEVGKRADLILLNADPRKDVANTRKLAAVILGGRYLSRSELDGMMSALAKKYAVMRSQPGLVGSMKVGGELAAWDD